MTTAEISQYLGLALAALALLGHAKGYFSSGEKSLEERMTKAETKLVEYDRRIQTVESNIQHLPTQASQHEIELTLVRMNGRLDTLIESLKPIKANGDMVSELLREQVKAASR